MDTAVCVHCGLCLPACPTYQETGMESASPRGRVFLLEAFENGARPSRESIRHIDECLDCRACEEVCPAHVLVGHRVDEFRRRHPEWVEEFGKKGGATRVARWLASPVGLRAFQWTVRQSRRPRLKHMGERWLPGSLQSLSRGLPNVIPSRLGRARRRARGPSNPASGPRVGLFLGCVMDAVYAGTNEHSRDLLADAGASVDVPLGQRCCGALSFHGGDEERARRLAVANLKAFESIPMVVVNAAGCGAFFKEYPTLFDGQSPWYEPAKALAERVVDIHQYLSDHLPERQARTHPAKTLTIHDACHLAHAQGIRQPLRDLLLRSGYQVAEMPYADRCCGSAGTYNLSHPEMADRLKRRKVADVPSAVDGLATGNPGCMLQIQAGLREAGRELRVAHTVDWLWEAYHGTSN